jgi:hypothetical protein
MRHSVTVQMVSAVLNEHCTCILMCPAVQKLTLCSSVTYDTTKPKTLCHITEDLIFHLGSAYRKW